MYVDGLEVSSNSGGIVNLRQDINTYIGGDKRDNIEFFQGVIDEVSIYEIPLDQSEVSLLYQGEILDNQPVAHWTFNEGQGSVVSNSIGNQFNGQISGASWSGGTEIFINNIPVSYTHLRAHET